MIAILYVVVVLALLFILVMALTFVVINQDPDEGTALDDEMGHWR